MRKGILCLFASLVLLWQASAQDNSEFVPESLAEKHLVNIFTIGGRPTNNDTTRKVSILVNHGYVVGYSEDRRNPLWSAYCASKRVGTVQPARFERAKFFFADTRSTSAVDGRTFGGGYDRGHMTPNFVISTQYGSLAQFETFLMTNMCPQKADLNQGPWQKLEAFVVEAAQKFEHVYVIAGPIFGNSPDVVPNGPDRAIQVPEAFFMILMDTSQEHALRPMVKMIAYRFPQGTSRTANFANRTQFGVSVNQIEAETNLDFFPEFNQMFFDWEQREDVKEMQHWTLN